MGKQIIFALLKLSKSGSIDNFQRKCLRFAFKYFSSLLVKFFFILFGPETEFSSENLTAKDINGIYEHLKVSDVHEPQIFSPKQGIKLSNYNFHFGFAFTKK